MPINIEMPRLSDTMQAGTVVKWNVKEGQAVKTGDVIADIETDKATMELQSFDDGVVAAVAVPEGKSVPIGTVIMVLAGKGEDPAAVKAGAGSAVAAASASARPGAVPAGAPASARADVSRSAAADSLRKDVGFSESEAVGTATGGPASRDHTGDAVRGVAASANGAGHGPGHGSGNGSGNGHAGVAGGRIFASPLARKIAADAGLDLGRVEGTGPGGRIVRKDVEAALQAGPAARQAVPAQASGPGSVAQRPPAPVASLPPLGAALEARRVPLSNMRRTIARRLVESKQTIPHYQVTVEVGMDALMDLRKQLNEQLAPQGVKLSVNDFLVRACALAMHQHPFVNARWVEAGGDVAIDVVGDVNVGVAIALDESKGGGLVVATLRQADRKGLRQISAETRALSDKARGKGLSVEEMSDSTFTISNLGMFGVDHFTAIINPPNAAILAVGAAVQKPVVRDGQLAVGHVMSMTMSSDHRIIDGAMAASYLATVKGMLERPATLLV